MPTTDWSQLVADFQQLLADAQSNTLGHWLLVRHDLESLLSDLLDGITSEQCNAIDAIIKSTKAAAADSAIDWKNLVARLVAAGKTLAPYILAILTLLVQKQNNVTKE
jgi:hypothetical protein